MDMARGASIFRRSRLDGADYKQLVIATNFSIAALARACAVTDRQLERYFKSRFGLRPHEFVERQRLAKAKQLLAAGQPVKAVCFVLSFKQPSHFTRVYSRFYGYPPSKERPQRP